MARNEKSFADGNTRALRLTEELRDLFVATMRMTGRTTICAQRCGISNTTAKDWIRRGRAEDADEIFRDFTAAVDKARSEFLLTAAGRLKQLALGGLIELPCYDRANNLVRDKDGNMIFSEKFFPPDVRALTFILDRCDPQSRENEADAPEGPALISDEDRRAQARAHYELTREALLILESLGQPLRVSLMDDSIETSARVSEFMPQLPPEPATIDVSPADEPATRTEPPKSDP